MAAWDAFEGYLALISEREKVAINERVRNRRNDLLAARSEEARVRIVADFVKEVGEILKVERK
jgi:hypothetical protein